MIDLTVSKQSEFEINWPKLEQLLKSYFPTLTNEQLSVKQFTEGYSNLTYLLRLGEQEMVLRRPPFGSIPPKAHDMQREFSLLEKVHPYFPLAPKPYFYEEDTSIMEKHFYVMERKNGIVLDEEIPSQYLAVPNVGQKISTTLIDTIVKLHAIDIEESNLIQLGKPEGYLTRQVHGWVKRCEQAKTDDVKEVPLLTKWLVDNIPHSLNPVIVHNDVKLNNMMLHPNDPSQAVALFDWEMCTVGDPLSELAISLSYWAEPGEGYTGLTSVTDKGDFLTRREMIELYATKTGRDVSNIDYYLTFAFFKTAMILQQIYYRYRTGDLEDERFTDLYLGINNLLEKAELAMHKQLLR